jgi:hypothetical protein
MILTPIPIIGVPKKAEKDDSPFPRMRTASIICNAGHAR